MWKISKTLMFKCSLNYKYWTGKINVISTASYQCCQKRPLSFNCPLAGSQEANQQNRPRAPTEASIVLCLRFSISIHIHPFTHTPSSFLTLFLLHWATEGEPVPSGTTLQIAVHLLQICNALSVM